MSHQKDDLIPTRASLVGRLKDLQDQSSWQEFFDTYWKLIYGVARKAGLSDTEAQDVVQETMASVAKHMPGFRYDPAIGSFKAWLLNMTRWRILSQFRNRGPLRDNRPLGNGSDEVSSTFAKIADPASQNLEGIWEAEWQTNLLEAAMANLKPRIDPKRFQIFDFYVNKGWLPEKVAALFNVSVDQVYLIKHRLIQTIQEEVKRLEKEMNLHPLTPRYDPQIAGAVGAALFGRTLAQKEAA